MGFIYFLCKRILAAIITIAVTITVSFFLMRLAPGGPFDLGRIMPPQVQANLKRHFHLDLPIFDQYLIYMRDLLHADLGPSMVYVDRSVSSVLASGLVATLQIGICAILLALVLGIAVGMLAAVSPNGLLSRLIVNLSMIGVLVPSFILAPLLSLILAFQLRWFAIAGWGDGSWYYLTLPVIAVALPQVGIIAKLMRASLMDVLGQMHVRTAIAKGLPPATVLVKHALRPALFPVISYMAPAMANILTGSVVVEQVFAIDGIGRYFVQGALNRDYTTVMGTVIVYTSFIVLFNMLTDLVYVLADPRVQVGVSND